MANLKDIKNAKRLLFVHQFLAMGDTLFLSPVYKAIKDNVHGIEISVLTNQYSNPFVKAISYVDEVYSLEHLFRDGASLVERLFKICLFFIKGRFDTIVLRDDKRMPQRSLLLASRLCRLRIISMGYYLEKEVREDRHIVETYFSVLEHAGIKIMERGKLYPNLSNISISDAKAFLKNKTEKLAGIAPVSNIKIKNWTPEKTAELIKKLNEMSYNIVFFCADKEFVKKVELFAGHIPLTIVGILDFSLLMGIISLCQLFVGVDTGVTHLASALNVPTIGLYGPTSRIVTGVYSEFGVSIQGESNCPYFSPTAPFSPKERLQECYIEDRCKISMTNCLEKIEVNKVIDAVQSVISTQGGLKIW